MSLEALQIKAKITAGEVGANVSVPTALDQFLKNFRVETPRSRAWYAAKRQVEEAILFEAQALAREMTYFSEEQQTAAAHSLADVNAVAALRQRALSKKT